VVADVAVIKRRLGVPARLASCHTAEVAGFALEGHVPAADVKRLLQKRPPLAGLAGLRAAALVGGPLLPPPPGAPSSPHAPLEPAELLLEGVDAASWADPAAPGVALVGSRTPSSSGEWRAYAMAREAARAGVVVVSGLARGVDAAAHRGALDGGGSDLALKPCKTLRDALQSKLEKLRACTEATSPQEALKALQTVRILCAQYSGPFGVEAVNAWVESHLRDRAAPPDALLQGRPVLITTNDYASGLMNGDLGVLWPDANNRMLAWFDNGEKEPRGVLPQRLPPHETAWAMTVHKSQGSEFDEVIVFLPETDSPLSSMQWLYTAITRAKKVCTVFGDRAAAEHAIRSETERRSGLAAQILRALGSVAQPTS
jgi:hypothetical protein